MSGQKCYLYISEFGDVIPVKIGDSSLETLQTCVEGWVGVVTGRLGGMDVDLWVNEEGLFRHDFAVNPIASIICGQTIVGPVVVARSDSEGRTVGFTDAMVERIAITDELSIYPFDRTADQIVASRKAFIESQETAV